MCLTEPDCATNFGQVKTRAILGDDGSYTITGTKIFISSSEHDLTENIIHIVLARTHDAPKGTRGISLYLVPKMHVQANGELAGSNSVYCDSIENKMRIHGSSNCVMNFKAAKGYLIGELNNGLYCMLYEYTTGVQALDLLGCKILLGKYKIFKRFIFKIILFIKQHKKKKVKRNEIDDKGFKKTGQTIEVQYA